MTQSLESSFRSPKTPTKSIVRPGEFPVITPTAIEELSNQIDSLIERGRKIRDLKLSVSRLSPTKSAWEKVPMAETTHSIMCGMESSDEVDGLVAYVNASDPLFMESPRNPILPSQMDLSETVPIEFARIPATRSRPVSAIRPLAETYRLPDPPSEQREDLPTRCVFSVSNVTMSSHRSADVSVRLRTLGSSGDTVEGTAASDVVVEVWGKKSNELVALGRKRKDDQVVIGGSVFSVTCSNIWTGDIVGTVGLSCTLPPAPIRALSEGFRPEELESAPLIFGESITTPSLMETVRVKSSPLLQSYSTPYALPPMTPFTSNLDIKSEISRKSIDSIASAAASIDEILSVSDDSPSSRYVPLLPSSNPHDSTTSKLTQSVADSVSSHLDSMSDPKSALNQTMRDLELLTQRLTTGDFLHSPIAAPTDRDHEYGSDDASPIETSFIPPPDFSHLFYRPTHHQVAPGSRRPRPLRRRSRKPARSGRVKSARSVSQSVEEFLPSTIDGEKEASLQLVSAQVLRSKSRSIEVSPFVDSPACVLETQHVSSRTASSGRLCMVFTEMVAIDPITIGVPRAADCRNRGLSVVSSQSPQVIAPHAMRSLTVHQSNPLIFFPESSSLTPRTIEGPGISGQHTTTSLETQRKEGIENARRTIAALRSTSGDRDRIAAVLKATGQFGEDDCIGDQYSE